MDSSSSSLQLQQDDSVDGGITNKIKQIFSSSRSRNASGQSNASSSSVSLASNNQPPPTTAEEMGQFVANLKDHSKGKIRKELDRSWVRGSMGHRVRESGENIFHACVRMEGTDKIIRILGEMVRGSSVGFEEPDATTTGGAVNDKSAEGFSPLHLAVQLAPLDNGNGGDVDAKIAALIDADLDAKIAALIGAGADREGLYAIGQQRVTPLQMAVFTGKLETVKVR